MSPQNQQQNNKKMANQNNQQQGGNNQQLRPRATPMIVERVNKIPIVSMAIAMGFAQYDKLKSSNVTVGEIMTKAENWAGFLFSKLRPVLDKFEEPITRADKIACSAMDYVEEKITSARQQEAKQ